MSGQTMLAAFVVTGLVSACASGGDDPEGTTNQAPTPNSQALKEPTAPEAPPPAPKKADFTVLTSGTSLGEANTGDDFSFKYCHTNVSLGEVESLVNKELVANGWSVVSYDNYKPAATTKKKPVPHTDARLHAFGHKFVLYGQVVTNSEEGCAGVLTRFTASPHAVVEKELRAALPKELAGVGATKTEFAVNGIQVLARYCYDQTSVANDMQAVVEKAGWSKTFKNPLKEVKGFHEGHVLTATYVPSTKPQSACQGKSEIVLRVRRNPDLVTRG